MLDDLAPILEDEKARDLLQRLEDKRVEQALPAEMELALLWALAQLGPIWAEPEWLGDARADAYTESLLAGRPAIIEIAATHDNEISGEEAMDAIARQISDYANCVEKRVGAYLYFSVNSESGYEDGEYFRRRHAPKDYQLSEYATKRIERWLKSGQSETAQLHIADNGLDVIIERKAYKQTRFHNIWSSMPPETHSLEDNPLYALLKRKLRQLRTDNTSALRIVFLADVGSTLLNRVGTISERMYGGNAVSGRDIIANFLRKNAARLDVIATFSPFRKRKLMGLSDLSWKVATFCRPGLDFSADNLQKLVEVLPKPRFEGYQARSLFRQGSYSPDNRGWYRGMSIKSGPDGFTYSVSARALLDLIAGRITPEQFHLFTGHRAGEKNFLQRYLESGKTLTKIEVSERELDQDDDYLILHFSDDPAAGALRLKNEAKGS